MKISAERLAAEANSTGFRPALLEKVVHLLSLLDALREHPPLRDTLVLKGGTALNLFTFAVPRLPVDIDVNYVGAEGRNEMLTDRPAIERALQSVASREGFGVARMPHEHAGREVAVDVQQCPGRQRHTRSRPQLHVPDSTVACQRSRFPPGRRVAGDRHTGA